MKIVKIKNIGSKNLLLDPDKFLKIIDLIKKHKDMTDLVQKKQPQEFVKVFVNNFGLHQKQAEQATKKIYRVSYEDFDFQRPLVPKLKLKPENHLGIELNKQFPVPTALKKSEDEQDLPEEEDLDEFDTKVNMANPSNDMRKLFITKNKEQPKEWPYDDMTKMNMSQKNKKYVRPLNTSKSISGKVVKEKKIKFKKAKSTDWKQKDPGIDIGKLTKSGSSDGNMSQASGWTSQGIPGLSKARDEFIPPNEEISDEDFDKIIKKPIGGRIVRFTHGTNLNKAMRMERKK